VDGSGLGSHPMVSSVMSDADTLCSVAVTAVS
jgi:hypothetical protein